MEDSITEFGIEINSEKLQCLIYVESERSLDEEGYCEGVRSLPALHKYMTTIIANKMTGWIMHRCKLQVASLQKASTPNSFIEFTIVFFAKHIPSLAIQKHSIS
eukprot:scaffold382_cov415-Chaetoceros_neogracile.AAC.7